MQEERGRDKTGRGDGVREECCGRKEISTRQARTEQIDELQRYERRRKRRGRGEGEKKASDPLIM